MVDRTRRANASQRGALAIGAIAALAVAVVTATGPSLAQEKAAPAGKAPAAKEAPKQAAPAGDAGKVAPSGDAAKAAPPADGAADAAKGGEQKAQSNWVKLCDKVPTTKRDKEGKEVKGDEKPICVTLQDIVDGGTGLTVVSAALRKIDDGSNKEDIMVTVPLGMVIPAGLRVYLLNKEQWDKVGKKEEVDEKSLKLLELKYQVCLPNGCVAQAEAGKDVVDLMRGDGGMVVRSIQTTGQIANIGISFAGFSTAYDGQPVDNAKFAQARQELMAAIAARRQEVLKTFEAEHKEAEKAGGAAAPGGTPKAPANKKGETKPPAKAAGKAAAPAEGSAAAAAPETK